MEIEKTRETSWKIQLKGKNESIELTSVEISGEVRTIKLSLISEEDSLITEMNKEEFFNFLTLISAFKDVVIGEETFLSDQTILEANSPQKSEEQEEFKVSPYSSNSDSSNLFEKKISDDELNPEEWDPW
jgi:hypothetical protein